MAFKKYEPRVRETSTTTLTTDFALGGAMFGSLPFSAAMANGDTCYYCASYGATFEEGIGTYVTAGNILQRTTVLRSGNAGVTGTSKISFAAGVKTIVLVFPASQFDNYQKWRDDLAAGVSTTNTGTAYNLTTGQGFTAFVDRAIIGFTVHVASGATVTINVDGLGTKALRKAAGVELVANNLKAGGCYLAQYRAAGNEWILLNYYSDELVDTIPGAFFLTGDITPPQIVANTNDYAPTGNATASVFRVTSDASRNLTGLVGGADGRIVTFYNVDSNPIVFMNESASSTAANRFTLGANVTLLPNQSLVLQYDSTTSRWRRLAGARPTQTRQIFLSGTAATYTTPTGCTRIVVKQKGAGGGGAAVVNTTNIADATAGGDTSFNSIVAKGGSAAGANPSASDATAPGAGGTGGAGSAYLRIPGQKGGWGWSANGSIRGPGGDGGGAGGGKGTMQTSATANAGDAGVANTGGGGGGGGFTSGGRAGGSGGGEGEYAEFELLGPLAATYTFTVGAGGAAGTATASTVNGGAGAAGIIIVDEYYD